MPKSDGPLRDAVIFVRRPGNKLPGYYREVPPGQESVHLFYVLR